MSLAAVQAKVKVKRFRYRLMASGIKLKAQIFGMGIVDVKWKAPFHSKVKYIDVRTEELACAEIRGMLKKHWTGFMIEEIIENKPEFSENYKVSIDDIEAEQNAK